MDQLKKIEKWFWVIVEKNGGVFIIFLMGIIYYLSIIPGVEDENSFSNVLYLWVEPSLQKFGHVAVYALLAIMWCIYLHKKVKISINIILVLLITVLFGVFGEYLQLYIPGRYASLSDCVLNLAGVVMGLLYCSSRLKVVTKLESNKVTSQ